MIYVLVAAIFLGLLATPLIRTFVTKNRMQNAIRQQESRDGVVEAIVYRALLELKMFYRAGGNSLEPMRNGTGVFAPTPRFTNANRRVFGKGEFQQDLLAPNGALFAPRRFFAPETDPQAWIDPPYPGGPPTYTLHVVTTLCGSPALGRTAFPPPSVANPDPGRGIPWVPACGGRIINVHYTGVFLAANLLDL